MDNETISRWAFESVLHRTDRMYRRLWVVCIILIIALIGSNAAWLYYENQYQVTETTVTQDASNDGEGDIILSNGGDVNGK